MKKLIPLLLALSLLCPAALGETFTAPGAFTLECPAGWEIDLSDCEDYSEPDDGYYYLGALIGEDAIVEISLQDCREDYDDLSLYAASAAEIAAYREDILDLLLEESDEAEFLEAWDENPQGVPFLIFYESSEDDGESYYADTISGGWCIYFYYYTYYEDDSLNADHLAVFQALLESLRPIQ